MAREARERPARFVFIVGTGRCGSSLLHEILARHPDVGFVSNVDDILGAGPGLGRWNNRLFRAVPPELARKGRARFAPSEGYRVLDRRVSPIVSAPFRDLTAEDVTPWLERRFRRFFEDRARVQGKHVFLHKFTGWPRTGFVDRIVPEARFIHVVRDGRAVANSLLQMPWWKGWGGPGQWGWGELPPRYADVWEGSGRSFTVLAGIEWMLLMDAYDEARGAVPDGRWLEIRYEDFLERPREQAGRMLAFMGLEWDGEFERGFRRYHLDAGRIDSYRDELSPEAVSQLDRAQGGHLTRWGYAVEHPGRGGGSLPSSGRPTSDGSRHRRARRISSGVSKAVGGS